MSDDTENPFDAEPYVDPVERLWEAWVEPAEELDPTVAHLAARAARRHAGVEEVEA